MFSKIKSYMKARRDASLYRQWEKESRMMNAFLNQAQDRIHLEALEREWFSGRARRGY